MRSSRGAYEAPAGINETYPSISALGGAGIALLAAGLGAAGRLVASRRA